MKSRNATVVSHKHRHALHTLHIDPRTDIMGPLDCKTGIAALLTRLGPQQFFYRKDLEKSS